MFERKLLANSFVPPTLAEQAEVMEYLLLKTQQEYYNKESTALRDGKRLPERSNTKTTQTNFGR